MANQKPKAAARSKKPANPNTPAEWQALTGPSDYWDWALNLKLPVLSKPYIRSKYQEPWRRDLRRSRKRRGPEEVGGFGEIGPPQARALRFLVDKEATVLDRVLRAIARFANELRSGGGWEQFDDPPGVDAVMPRRMTAAQAAERIEITGVGVSAEVRDGIAYLEIKGECAWDPDHGFEVALHRSRIVDVYQQGTTWDDRAPRKPKRKSR